MAECLHPIYIDRLDKHVSGCLDGQSLYKRIRIPCGKCVNCLKNRQNKLIVRIVSEAEKYQSMHFVTLTYDEDHLPFASSLWFRDVDGSEMRLCKSDLFKLDFLKDIRETFKKVNPSSSARYLEFPIDSFNNAYGDGTRFFARITPSLDREDVKLWLKRSRIAYKRAFGEDLPKWKYVLIGEYGSRTARPHYHALILGLSSTQVHFICRQWKNGNFLWKKCVDGSDSRYAVARYVSKYLVKGKFDVDSVTAGDAQKGRIQASKGLGLLENPPLSYFYAWDVFGVYDPDTLKLNGKDYLSDDQLRVLADVIPQRMSVCVPGCKYRLPLPDQWKKTLFYNKIKVDSNLISDRYVPKTIFKIVKKTLEDRELADSEREFSEFARLCAGASVSEVVLRFNSLKELDTSLAESSSEKAFCRFYQSDSF